MRGKNQPKSTKEQNRGAMKCNQIALEVYSFKLVSVVFRPNCYEMWFQFEGLQDSKWCQRNEVSRVPGPSPEAEGDLVEEGGLLVTNQNHATTCRGPRVAEASQGCRGGGECGVLLQDTAPGPTPSSLCASRTLVWARSQTSGSSEREGPQQVGE